MARCDMVVKFGGSAITDKDHFETLRRPELAEAAQSLKCCHQLGFKFIIVHGAGSFGHHQAKKYGINQGYAGLPELDQHRVKIGFSETRISVLKLNQLVVQALVDEGIPAVSVSACGMWQTDRGKVIQDGCRTVESLLEAGFVPVLHGDCVVDRSLGCRILSGDTIVKVLSETFTPKRVIFLTDTDGIFDRPPQLPGAVLLPIIEVDQRANTNVTIETDVNIHDVTGGVQLRIDTAIEVVKYQKHTVRVLICSVRQGAFCHACRSGNFGESPGTIIKFKEST